MNFFHSLFWKVFMSLVAGLVIAVFGNGLTGLFQLLANSHTGNIYTPPNMLSFWTLFWGAFGGSFLVLGIQEFIKKRPGTNP